MRRGACPPSRSPSCSAAVREARSPSAELPTPRLRGQRGSAVSGSGRGLEVSRRGAKSRHAPCPWPHSVTRPPCASASSLTSRDKGFYLARWFRGFTGVTEQKCSQQALDAGRSHTRRLVTGRARSPEARCFPRTRPSRPAQFPSQRNSGRKSVDRSLTPPPKLRPPGHAAGALAAAVAFHL